MSHSLISRCTISWSTLWPQFWQNLKPNLVIWTKLDCWISTARNLKAIRIRGCGRSSSTLLILLYEYVYIKPLYNTYSLPTPLNSISIRHLQVYAIFSMPNFRIKILEIEEFSRNFCNSIFVKRSTCAGRSCLFIHLSSHARGIMAAPFKLKQSFSIFGGDNEESSAPARKVWHQGSLDLYWCHLRHPRRRAVLPSLMKIEITSSHLDSLPILQVELLTLIFFTT